MDFLLEYGYFGLFLSSFLAATILPIGSEIILVTLLAKGINPYNLVLIATIGNVLGSIVNYFIGYYAGNIVIFKILKISKEDLNKAKDRFNKYGVFSLLFAWVPIIGDPITVVAGIARTKISLFTSLVFIGKFSRYVFIAYIVLYYM